MKKLKINYFLIFFVIFVISISAYFYCTKKNLSRIPITVGYANIPQVKVEIQGEEFLLDVDSGSKFQLTLNKGVLTQLKKTPCGTLQGKDAMGNSYESPAYSIRRINIGRHVFENVVVKEVNDDYVAHTTFHTGEEQIGENLKRGSGTVGRDLLEKMNLLFDFQNGIILECNDIKHLKKAAYSLDDLVPIPLERGRTGVILNVDTDWGILRLSLDTGSTLTLIKHSLLKNSDLKQQECELPHLSTSKFKIGNKDFGNLKMYLFDITSELHEIDGVLGMDFLKNHVVYINHQDHVIYVGVSTSAN